MRRAVLVGLLAGSAPLLLLATLVRGGWGAWVFGLLAALWPALLAALGLRSGRRGRPALLVLAASALCLVVASAIVLAGSGTAAAPSPGAIAMLVGLWLVPLLIGVVGYALVFERASPSAEELRELRERSPRSGQAP